MAEERNDFIQLLLNFRENIETSSETDDKKKSWNDGWGCDHSNSFFELMSTDRSLLNKFLRETIATTTDFKTMGYLFSRYTCFKFFERFGISFWRSLDLLEIPRNDFLDFFPIAELRTVFGEKAAKSLFEQFLKDNPVGSVQAFSNYCADYNTKHAEERRDILQKDFAKPAGQRLFIHFFKKKDWGVWKKDPPSATKQKSAGQKRISTSSPSSASKMPKLVAETKPVEPTRRSLRKQLQNEKNTEPGDERDVLVVLENSGEEKIVDFDADDEKQMTSLKNGSTTTTEQNTTDNAAVVPEISGDPSASEEMAVEIPAFSLEDLKHFEHESDPYALYALTFACFERNSQRMQHVIGVLKREKLNKSGVVEQHQKMNGVIDDNEQSLKLVQELAEKLRNFMCFFLPKSSKLTAEQIKDMTLEELCHVNLAEFGKDCEAEFSRLLQDRKRTVREQYDSQCNRIKNLLLRSLKKYCPQLKLQESMTVEEIEQKVLPIINGLISFAAESDREDERQQSSKKL